MIRDKVASSLPIIIFNIQSYVRVMNRPTVLLFAIDPTVLYPVLQRLNTLHLHHVIAQHI